MASRFKVADKAEFLDRVQKRAYELEENCRGCSQATLLAIQEAFGLDGEMLYKAASGLAGGIGLMNSACGALTAGALALGLKYGRELADLEKLEDKGVAKLQSSYEPVQRLYKWFEQEFGSVICAEIRKSLHGVYLDSKITWQKELAENLGFHRLCSELVGKAARRAAELMIDK